MQDTLRDDVSTLETEISSGESIDALNVSLNGVERCA